MAARRDRYKRLEQLYVVGKELVFPDGTMIWVQVMNPLQNDEARNDAQTARARMSLALKEVGSDAQTTALGVFMDMSKAEAINGILNHKWQGWFNTSSNRLADDPEWEERNQIMTRTDPDEMARRDPEDPERQIYEKITEEFQKLVSEDIEMERQYESVRLEGLEPNALRDEYLELYRTERSVAAANAEYRIVEGWYSARICEATPVDGEDGVWDHSACANHEERVWETRDDFRSAPGPLQDRVREVLDELTMSVREAKNSDSTTSSSASSVLQSGPEESTPSTQEGTLATVPGTST
jgi:hypothetical protein